MPMEPSSLKIGWPPPATSMMLSRRCPRPTGPRIKNPSPSGPRCVSAPVARVRRASSTRLEDSRSQIPTMPHMEWPSSRWASPAPSFPRRPEPILDRVASRRSRHRLSAREHGGRLPARLPRPYGDRRRAHRLARRRRPAGLPASRLRAVALDEHPEREPDAAPHPDGALPRVEALSRDRRDELGDDQGTRHAPRGDEQRAPRVAEESDGGEHHDEIERHHENEADPAVVEQELQVRAVRVADGLLEAEVDDPGRDAGPDEGEPPIA